MNRIIISLIKLSTLILFILLTSNNLYPEQVRLIPPQPDTTTIKIEFNGETIKGYYLLLDFRTSDEKKRDLEKKSLAGDLIIFTNGHAQRADDGYPLTSKLAAWSKSGIVIVPVCDTPFGTRKELRGDKGKDIILIEMIRYILSGMALTLDNYKPVSDMKIRINKQDIPSPAPESIKTGLTLMGWSHGALLARRLASAYPDCVNSLVQMAPAGFVDWGGEYCTGPACLMSSFAGEGACISLGVFRGEWTHIFDSGWGITKGMGGDTLRSCSSCISGNFSFLKPFRAHKDTKDCTLHANDAILPVDKVKNITVIFAVDDSLFEYDDHGGIKDPKNVTQLERELFFEKYYPAAVKAGAKCTLTVLPGNHIGPIVNSGKFAETALTSTEQKK